MKAVDPTANGPVAPIYDLRDLVWQRSARFRLQIDAFTLAPGEKVAIVGPNGSGKTSLLRLLALLERPTRWGRFVYRGRELPRGPGQRSPGSERRGALGFLKQQPYLFAGTVRANLAYPLRLRRVPALERDRRVEAMLALVDLTALADAPVDRLSGGEQKRLALGRVLIGNQDLLLLDEPAAHLDRRSRRVIERLLAESEASWLLATHDLHLAHRLADRVLSLKSGRLAPALPENVLEGRYEEDGLRTAGGLLIHLPPQEEVARPDNGPAAAVMLDPRHVVLSLEPLESSMRNQFRGRVCAVHQHGGTVWVEVDCGERLTSIISRESYGNLGLNLGREVVVSFKVHAVEVL